MKIKEGANIQGLDLRMRPVLIAADDIWSSVGQELVVTCGLDGCHSAGSMHYYGLALDFRTHYFSETTKKIVFEELIETLGCTFDVVMHSTHIHVEYKLL